MKDYTSSIANIRFSRDARTLVSSFLAVIMLIFIIFTGPKLGLTGTDITLCAVYFAVFYFAGLLTFFSQKGTGKMDIVLFFGAGLAAVVYVRTALMYYQSRDYNIFLSQWLSQMRQYSGISALAADIGDYTAPYRCFLFILSRFNGNDMMLIKMFSMCFDLVGAYYMMKLVELRNKNVSVKALAFLLTLAAPTVFLNSAMWGQCDMIYAAFCLASLYYALTDRSRLSVIMFSVAFAFKLQAVFFLPALGLLVLIRKVRWRDLLWFPAVQVIAALPCVLAGQNIVKALTVYLHQTGEYSDMHLNAPSIWRFIGDNKNVNSSNFGMLAIMLTGLAVLAVIYLCYANIKKLDDRRLVNAAFIMSLMIPFLLPRMHDRYFFLADVMSILYFFYNKKRWYVPCGVIFASYVSYAHYLIQMSDINQLITAAVLLVILAICLRELVDELLNAKEVPCITVQSDCVDGVNTASAANDTADVKNADAAVDLSQLGGESAEDDETVSDTNASDESDRTDGNDEQAADKDSNKRNSDKKMLFSFIDSEKRQPATTKQPLNFAGASTSHYSAEED